MRIVFVSRHPGAVQWAADLGVPVDTVVEHLQASEVQRRDVVIGVLPLSLAAQLCERGAQVFALSVPLPLALRGQELPAATLHALGATLQQVSVHTGACGAEAIALLRRLCAGDRDKVVSTYQPPQPADTACVANDAPLP